MTYYEVLLVLHIVAAIIWLGAGFQYALVAFGADRRGDRDKIREVSEDIEWLTPRLFIPSSLAVFVLGILLVADGAWEFDQLWITIAMAGWLISFCLGFFYFKPMTERVEALKSQAGSEAEIDAILDRVIVIDRVQLTILFLVVIDMVLKPTGDDPGLLIAGAAIVALATAAAAARLRRGPSAASA